MDKELTKKIYSISRIIIVFISFIIFSIMFINEDESWRIIPFLFALIAFVISYPSSFISKKIIKIGDKFNNILLKLLYYLIILPIIIFIVLVGVCFIGSLIIDAIPNPKNLGEAIGQVLIFLFVIAICIICIVVPYIQSLIVLVLKKFIKK